MKSVAPRINHFLLALSLPTFGIVLPVRTNGCNQLMLPFLFLIWLGRHWYLDLASAGFQLHSPNTRNALNRANRSVYVWHYPWGQFMHSHGQLASAASLPVKCEDVTCWYAEINITILLTVLVCSQHFADVLRMQFLRHRLDALLQKLIKQV